MNKPYWLLVCQLNVCIFWCLLWWVGQCRLPSCMAGCLGGLPAAWEVPQPWLSSHLQGANSKPWVELWALSRTQKMRFRQVTAHWYSAWSRKCRVWQCRTMYDNVWYVNSSPPMNSSYSWGPLRRQQTLPCRMLAWVQRPRSSLRKPRRCWSATQDVFLQWPIHIYIDGISIYQMVWLYVKIYHPYNISKYIKDHLCLPWFHLWTTKFRC